MTDGDGENKGVNPPQIWSYTDFRAYLRDWFEYRRSLDGKFSIRWHARRVGLSDGTVHNLLKDRAPEEKTETKLIEMMRLDSDEAEYFRGLVKVARASSIEGAAEATRALMTLGGGRSRKVIEGAVERYASGWLNHAVRELALADDFDERPEVIAARLIPSVSPAEVAECLTRLIGWGLLQRGFDGKLRAVNVRTDAGIAMQLSAGMAYYDGVLDITRKLLHEVPGAERFFSSSVFNLELGQIQVLKPVIYEALRKITDVADALPRSEHAEVVQIGIQLFPLTRRPPAEPKIADDEVLADSESTRDPNT
ncbi:MAG: TIGR02147 family protein [Deltaproteobacteria bacterium]|nr:TIGR02147 family protein [Deltaproteobacteria bacterium]